MRTLLVTLLLGCVHPIGGPLEDAREARVPPPEGFVLTYEEQEGPFGARRIVLDSEGALALTRWRPGFVPALDTPETILRNDEVTQDDEGAVVTEAQVRAEDMVRLVDVLVSIEGWKHRGSGLPNTPIETGRARLTLRLGGESSEATEYVRDLDSNDRLVRVRQLLDEVLLAASSAPAPAPE
ncbi:MAG: hypothetical protein AAGE52_28945 [Myxococcota bacterium]